ncbi:hypothetical protein [Nocardioides sp. InS609-2]|uniref:hypothetical protein n=1 Tax=Nocardioides sp. InS609-2 TaxID=2760705 RepID=UPI0020BE3333|nr:hypothetical protein [Nocardioides sp. InS609-2]
MTLALPSRAAATVCRLVVCVLLGTFLSVAGPAHAADTAPPDTAITMGPAATLTPGPVFFEFTSTEPGTFQCAIDGGGRFPCETPYAATVTTLGPHTFTVAAVDPSGNIDPLPATYGFTIVAPTPVPATVSAKAVSGKRKLRVDVDPDWDTGDYELTVQKQKSGTWKTIRRSSTRGSRDVRTMDLRGGRYRVVTSPANGLAPATSGTVRLRR